MFDSFLTLFPLVAAWKTTITNNYKYMYAIFIEDTTELVLLAQILRREQRALSQSSLPSSYLSWILFLWPWFCSRFPAPVVWRSYLWGPGSFPQSWTVIKRNRFNYFYYIKHTSKYHNVFINRILNKILQRNKKNISLMMIEQCLRFKSLRLYSFVGNTWNSYAKNDLHSNYACGKRNVCL